jgi:hypothetical protein
MLCYSGCGNLMIRVMQEAQAVHRQKVQTREPSKTPHYMNTTNSYNHHRARRYTAAPQSSSTSRTIHARTTQHEFACHLRIAQRHGLLAAEGPQPRGRCGSTPLLHAGPLHAGHKIISATESAGRMAAAGSGPAARAAAGRRIKQRPAARAGQQVQDGGQGWHDGRHARVDARSDRRHDLLRECLLLPAPCLVAHSGNRRQASSASHTRCTRLLPSPLTLPLPTALPCRSS